MIIKEKFYYCGMKTGKKKDGSVWNLVQTLDNDGKHFNFFTTKSEAFNDLTDGSEFQLTLNVYYDLKNKQYKFIVKEITL